MEHHSIVIIGAGPTGIGAGYRLTELGHPDWLMAEADDHAGGLSSSFVDPQGFTWDLGGHVMFSHFDYYDRAFEQVMGGDYYSHWRESYIWILDRLVPYPFQNNLKYLPADAALDCIMGLVEAHCRQNRTGAPTNFKEWILAQFGKGIAARFMLPYNFKVWAYPPERMAADWIAERVSVVEIESVLRNILESGVDSQWGPNDRFRFPKNGGTGDLWRRFARSLSKPVALRKRATAVDLARREVTFADGDAVRYENLISTMPLNRFLNICCPVPDPVRESAARLVSNRVHVVGIGLRQPCPSRKNWIYFPESNAPFYRATYFSNYSPAVTPAGGNYYSLLCETADSPHKPQNAATVVADTIQGLVETRILRPEDLDTIVTRQRYTIEDAYPVPTLDLNRTTDICLSFLEDRHVLSRGRFGAWHYRIGNMDHSFMQGVEAVDRILFDKRESVLRR